VFREGPLRGTLPFRMKRAAEGGAEGGVAQEVLELNRQLLVSSKKGRNRNSFGSPEKGRRGRIPGGQSRGECLNAGSQGGARGDRTEAPGGRGAVECGGPRGEVRGGPRHGGAC